MVPCSSRLPSRPPSRPERLAGPWRPPRRRLHASLRRARPLLLGLPLRRLRRQERSAGSRLRRKAPLPRSFYLLCVRSDPRTDDTRRHDARHAEPRPAKRRARAMIFMMVVPQQLRRRRVRRLGVFLRRPRFRSPSAPLRCPLHASLRRMCRFYPRTMPTLMTFSRSTAKAFHVSARFRAHQPAASRSRLLSPVATGSRHAHRAVRRLRLPRLAQPRQVRNASVAVAGHPARRNHALTRLTDASARCRGHPSSSTSFLTAHWKYSYPYRHSLGVASLFPAMPAAAYWTWFCCSGLCCGRPAMLEMDMGLSGLFSHSLEVAYSPVEKVSGVWPLACPLSVNRV